METIQRILQGLSGNIVDAIVYTAIALVTLLGIFKCIMPLRQSIHCLRRAVRVLNRNPVRDNGAPIWENELFMGRGMANAWRRFLQNAQQLDARGMTCDVREYINDDTAIYDIGNIFQKHIVPFKKVRFRKNGYRRCTCLLIILCYIRIRKIFNYHTFRR